MLSSSGTWAIPPKPAREVTRRSPGLKNSLTLLACLTFSVLLPSSIKYVGKGEQLKNSQRHLLYSLASRGFRSGWRWEPSSGDGHWPSRGRERKGLPKYVRV